MPALYAHLRFGEEVAKTLSPALQQLLQTHTGTFCLGTQGPDILFYHKPMKKNELRSFGTQLHKKTGEEVFCDQAQKLMQEQEQGNKQSALLAYVCGFLCHFTLDVFCHPYIDANSSKKLSHGKIESEFDKYVLRKDGKKIRGYNTAKPIPRDEQTIRSCAKSLGVPDEAIALSVKTIRKINRMFSFPFEPFHWIAHGFLKLVKMQRKFGDMFLHRKDDSLCKEISQELFVKWQSAVPVAQNLIEEYCQAIVNAKQPNLTNELYRYNFSGVKFTEE